MFGCALALLIGCKAGEEGEGSDDAQTSSASTSETSSETNTSETNTSETSSESEGTESSTTTTDSGGGSFYAGPDPDLPPAGAWEDLDDSEPAPALRDHGARYRLSR